MLTKPTLYAQDQDGLVHFTWSERQQGGATSAQEPEVDIVLFPGGGTFSKLPGRRMFILTHHDDHKLFFWWVYFCTA
jgi:hypothetical protein